MNVLEYICLDDKNKFRSKLVLTEKSIDDIESLIVDSSLIDNVIDSNYDIVLIPTKIVKNPFHRDDRHWLVLCEYKYPTGVSHKNNNRFKLEQIVQNNADIHIGITQEFVLCNKTFPLGWNDNIDVFKNYSGNLEFSQHSEPIIHELIEALIYSGITINEVTMRQIVGKWMIKMGMINVMEACDNLILFRYIAQKICFNHNIIFCLTSDPVTNSSIYSHCYFYISTPDMRDPEHGLQSIVEACEKLKLKHLEHHKLLSETNGKRFTYSQSNMNNSVQVILGEEQNGMIKEKRCGANSDPYHVLTILLKTITTTYNIDTVSHDLETLKERFNYHRVVEFDSEKPKIQQKQPRSFRESSSPMSEPSTLSEKSLVPEKKKEKEKKTGLTGLASILKLNEDSDDDDINENKEENEKNRVECIISSLKKMKLSHNILQSVTAPKSVTALKDANIASEPILPPQQYEPVNPHNFLPTTHNYTPNVTPQSSLYTLPSQINQSV
jgi:glutamine synthetase